MEEITDGRGRGRGRRFEDALNETAGMRAKTAKVLGIPK